MEKLAEAMNVTLNDEQYSYFKMPAIGEPCLVTLKSHLSIIQTTLRICQWKENAQPTVGKQTFLETKSTNKMPARLELDVGGAYGRQFYVGIKCGANGRRDANGVIGNAAGSICDFQVSYLIQKKPVFRRPANGKVECEKTQKFVGAFKVDLILPKVKSEPFIQWSVKQMLRLNYTVATIREVIRETIQYTMSVDKEKLDKMQHTQSRLRKVLSKEHNRQ